MKTFLCGLLLAVVAGSEVACLAQGTLQITFDGLPIQPPGTAFVAQSYSESGMLFTQYKTLGTNVLSSSFARNGGGISEYPDNGTAFLEVGSAVDTLVGRFTDGSLFTLRSIDLAEYSTVVPVAVTAHFVGYKPNGGTVTRDITTDGIIDGTGPLDDFQTFDFANYPKFSGLSRLEITTTYATFSLDNLVVSVPEPNSAALFIVGGLALWAAKFRSKRTNA